MALPDTGIDDELIEDEKLDDMFSGWGASQQPEDTKFEQKNETSRPSQMERVSREIGETLKEIATGEGRGQYPAIDTIVNQDPHRYAHTVCDPERCPNRKAATMSANRLITDVRPSVRERLYSLERDCQELEREFREHKEESIRAGSGYSTKDQLLNMREYIKEDLKPRIEKLEGRRVIRDWGLTISLTISLIYSVILTYKVFIES